MDITAPRFTNEDQAREHLEALRWPDGPFCPHCGSFSAKRLPAQRGKPSKRNPEGSVRKGVIQCNDCRQQYSVTVGTLFEDSKVPLHKWLLANHLLCASKKGMSAKQIERMLGVSYKTAWFMMHRIREAMKPTNPEPLGGPGKVVESDEAVVGGFKKKRLSGKVAPKKKIVTLVERGGSARSFHITNIDHKNVRTALVTSADRSSVLMTDDAKFYRNIGREFAGHHTTLHSSRQFAKPGGIHSNTAENFFSIFKRGLVGTYHHMSGTHLNRYLAEFDFRYNTKGDTDFQRSDEALKGIEGKRLTYRRTDQLAA